MNSDANTQNNIIIRNEIQSQNTSTTQNIIPIIQYAQKCAHCGEYLLGDQILEFYKGLDERYVNWLCHEECNKLYSKNN